LGAYGALLIPANDFFEIALAPTPVWMDSAIAEFPHAQFP
jgi:hypothetical protein